MNRTAIPQIIATLLPLASLHVASGAPVDRPNIVFILADDIGYGDFGCYGATKIKTPNIDKLAAGGLRFTDAYAPAATCTPTRFGLMTGKYAWRQEGTHVLPGNAPLIIKDGVPTIASILKAGGYATGAVGKWHLGLGRGDLNFNKEIGAGPRTVGFDYSFIIPATGDRVPCVFVENHKTVNLDPADPITVRYEKGKEAGSVVSGIRRIGFMSGGKSALWKDEDIADTLTGKAIKFLKTNASTPSAGSGQANPFFLYFATHDVHAPLVPHPRFRGTSQAALRGDAVQSFDWCVGEIVKTLQEQGVADNTMLFVTSDNGGYPGHAPGYSPNGPLRGFKSESFEGGVRIPLIAFWPGHIKPGKTDSIVSLTDMMATITAAVGLELPGNAGPDSINQLPVFLNLSKQVRNNIVTQYTYASGPKCPKSIREGKWKLIVRNKGEDMLFNLESDLAEKHNLIEQKPGEADHLRKLLKEIMADKKTR